MTLASREDQSFYAILFASGSCFSFGLCFLLFRFPFSFVLFLCWMKAKPICRQICMFSHNVCLVWMIVFSLLFILRQKYIKCVCYSALRAVEQKGLHGEKLKRLA